MWKIITIVVAVICVGAASAVAWDGHQAADDAAAARKQAKALNARAAAAHGKTVKLTEDAAKLDARSDVLHNAGTEMLVKANAIKTSVGNVTDASNLIQATINPIVSQTPSAAARATLTKALQALATNTAQATTDAGKLRVTAAALTSAAR